MQELGLQVVVERISEAIREEDYDLANGLLWPALDQKWDVAQLWFYAGILTSLGGKQAPAYEFFKKSQELEPHPANWGNLGGVLRTMGRIEECRTTLLRGLEYAPDSADILGNLAGSFVNEGDPHAGIEFGERALILTPDHRPTMFNLALLYLEAGEYARGFDLYAEGAHRHRVEKTYDPDPPMLTPELHEQLRGKGKRLVVYGEQGIGDELMFATIMRDARRDYEVIFDCHPRLETLHRFASWTKSPGYPITLHPTRKIDSARQGWNCEADVKMPLGNLGRFYRRTPASFTWHGNAYSPDPHEVREMRAFLEKLAGGRKIIGLALRGGTMQTARLYRMMPPQAIQSVLADPRYLFVSLDYEDMTNFGDYMVHTHGPGRFLWYPSVCWAWDYAHQAALVKATDVTVTVCQSIAHMSAAMGHPTYVLTPSRPAWRYGLKDERWYWYPHANARLLRQKGSDWGPASSQLHEALQARFFAEEAA